MGWNQRGILGDHVGMPFPPTASARRRVRLTAAAAAAAALLGGCGSSAPPAPTGPDTVVVANFDFTPADLTVHVGDTVTWEFRQPDAPHNVVSLTDPVLFASGAPKGSGTFRFTFHQVGTFPYTCQVHPAMRGTVTVTP